MNIETLQDALERWDAERDLDGSMIDITLIVDAARLVADPERLVADFGKRILAHESEGKVTIERAQTELLNLFAALTLGDTDETDDLGSNQRMVVEDHPMSEITLNESIAMFEVSRSVKPWDHLKDEVVAPMLEAASLVADQDLRRIAEYIEVQAALTPGDTQ